MLRKILVSAILGQFSGLLMANEIEAGKLYTGPIKVSSSYYGLAITIPRGYRGALAGETFVIEPNKNPKGSIYVLAMPMTLSEAKQTMMAGFSLASGVYLKIIGQAEIKDKVIKATYKVQGQSNKAYVITKITNNGNGISFIALYQPQVEKQFKTVLGKISGTTRVSKPKSSGYWAKVLSGSKLIYRYNGWGTNYTERKEIVLCRNGRFTQSSNAGSMQTSPSSNSISHLQSGSAGRWMVSGSQQSGQLYLQFDNGAKSEYQINSRQGSLYLNGSKYFRQPAGC